MSIGFRTGRSLESFDNDWEYQAWLDKIDAQISDVERQQRDVMNQLIDNATMTLAPAGPFLEGEGFDPGRDEEFLPWDYDRDGDLDPPDEGDDDEL